MRLAIFQTMSSGKGDHKLWFAIDELDPLGVIDGLPDALVRLRRLGGRCVIGFQSIGQVSATFGQGPAEAIVENCGTTVILRCSASERAATSRFASQLIGDRQIVRISKSRNAPDFIGGGKGHHSHSDSEPHATEPAVMAAEIEQLPDRAVYLKVASHPAWAKVHFPIYHTEGGQAISALSVNSAFSDDKYFQSNFQCHIAGISSHTGRSARGACRFSFSSLDVTVQRN
jgi:type IV secretory pathway TraG/TraD family ATPase VirD4